MSDVYAPAAPAKNRRKRPLLIGLVVAAIVLIGSAAAVGVYLLTSETDIVNRLSPNMTVSGTVTLPLKDMSNWGTSCAGRGGYEDLKVGAAVVVTDDAAKTVGIGKVDSAKEVDGQCVLAWSVKEVPKGLGFYGVTVTHRGTVQFSAEQVGQPLQLSIS